MKKWKVVVWESSGRPRIETILMAEDLHAAKRLAVAMFKCKEGDVYVTIIQ
jgi:hypothetical protein